MPASGNISFASHSFWKHIYSVPTNRKYLLWALGVSLLQFLILKYFYPYPDFISDSDSYIYAAQQHLVINVWPIGYSFFLSIVHVFSHSGTTLSITQYLLLELTGLYLFFTLQYLYRPTKLITLPLFILLCTNPLLIYLSNFVNSDALFTALSFIWISQLLWTIQSPNIWSLLANAILVFLCFTVRNNAYYYPIVAAIAFLLSGQRTWFKVLGIALPLTLIIPFILYTENAAYKVTGTRQFSLFTGWQLANNALYAYEWMSVDTTQLPDQNSRELDRLARKFYSRTPTGFREYLADYTGNYFIKEPASPLKLYVEHHYTMTDQKSIMKVWGQASAIFSKYGSWLIRTHPYGYLQGYVQLNIKNYLCPPLSNFEKYNIGSDDVGAIGQDWFDWKTPEIRSASKDAPQYLFRPFQILFLFLNVYIIGASLLLLFKFKQWKKNTSVDRKMALFTLAFLIVNFGFTILATINILRYQVVPMIIALISALWMTTMLDKKATKEQNIKIQPQIASII